MMNVKTKASPLHNNTIVFSKVLFFIKFKFWNLSFNLLTQGLRIMLSSLELFCWLSPYITEPSKQKCISSKNFHWFIKALGRHVGLHYHAKCILQRSGGHIGFVTQRVDHQKWNCISMQKLCIWRQSSHWETKEWRQYWMYWSPKTTHVTW